MRSILNAHISILAPFLLILAGLMLAACGQSKPETYRIGVVSLGSFSDSLVDSFKAGMTVDRQR